MDSQIAPFTNNFGVERVVLVSFGTVIAVLVFDLFLVLLGRHPWGHWVRAWARRYPLFAAGIAAVTGALVGHFFYATKAI